MKASLQRILSVLVGIIITAGEAFVNPFLLALHVEQNLRPTHHILFGTPRDDQTRHAQNEQFNEKTLHNKQTFHEDTEKRRVSLLIKISYDASRFSGFSAGNDATTTNNVQQQNRTTHPPRSSRRRRNRNLYSADSSSTGIRSVQGVLQLAFSKLYGNIDPTRVVVEGASRTDKGVHAVGMSAQIYALSVNYADATNSSEFHEHVFIDGKRLPHPRNDTDPSETFVSLPMTLEKLAFSLNRMLPPDIRVTAHARLPQTEQYSFHASLSATGKTYTYRLAMGTRSDPTQVHWSWYAGDLSWNQEAVSSVIDLLTACVHNFTAFRGAPRGKDDKRKWQNQSAMCRLENIVVSVKEPDYDWDPTYISITFTGDRFLYKMVRFLVGTLLGVATGTMTPAQVQDMLDTGRRPNNTVVCAPAHGLTLQQVHYSPAVDWIPANS